MVGYLRLYPTGTSAGPVREKFALLLEALRVNDAFAPALLEGSAARPDSFYCASIWNTGAGDPELLATARKREETLSFAQDWRHREDQARDEIAKIQAQRRHPERLVCHAPKHRAGSNWWKNLLAPPRA